MNNRRTTHKAKVGGRRPNHAKRRPARVAKNTGHRSTVLRKQLAQLPSGLRKPLEKLPHDLAMVLLADVVIQRRLHGILERMPLAALSETKYQLTKLTAACDRMLGK